MHRSVFDNMDRISKMITEAEGDTGNSDDTEENETNDEEQDTTDTNTPDDMEEVGQEDTPVDEPIDPTVPTQQAQPADEQDGVFISNNQIASIAKTILDALQAQPPAAGEIPQELLTVTDQNANAVIKFIQSYISLDSSSSLKDTGNKNEFVSQLKDA